MPIEIRQAKVGVFLSAIIFLLGTASFLRATTVEVENEDDDVSAVPTPVQKTSSSQAVSQNDKAVDSDLEMEGENKEVLPASSPTLVSTPTPVMAVKRLPSE